MRLVGRSSVLMAFVTLILGAAALFGAGQTPAPAGKTAAPAAQKASPAPKTAAPAPKTAAPAADAAAPIDGIWPRDIKTSIGTITIYQPQVDSWDGVQIEFRLAVSVKATAGKDGNVYKRTGEGGWEQQQPGGSWDRVQDRGQTGTLDAQQRARSSGDTRTQGYDRARTSGYGQGYRSGGGYGGGGMRGGGGRRR